MTKWNEFAGKGRARAASLAVATALAILAPQHALAALIVNGDFEGGPGIALVPTGWVVAPGVEIGVAKGLNYSPPGAGSAAAMANHFVYFGGGDLPNVSVLSQEFVTIAGAHTLSFDFGTFSAFGGNFQTLTAQVFNGATLLATNNFTREGTTNFDTLFQSYTLDFVSAGGATRVAFNVDAPTRRFDGLLDNVAVSGPPGPGVPEPATWAMMLMGFGGLGAVLRRRRGLALAT